MVSLIWSIVSCSENTKLFGNLLRTSALSVFDMSPFLTDSQNPNECTRVPVRGIPGTSVPDLP